MSVVISDVTKRFNKTVSLLVKNKKCKSVKQFANECGLLPHSLSEVKMLRRNVTLEMLEKICHHYGVDGDYLLIGNTSMKENISQDGIIMQSEFDKIDNLLQYLKSSDKDWINDCLKYIEHRFNLALATEIKGIKMPKEAICKKQLSINYPPDWIAKQKKRTNPSKNNTTGLLGVHKQKNRYRSQIQANGRIVRLGYFNTPEEAHEAYLLAQQKLLGSEGINI